MSPTPAPPTLHFTYNLNTPVGLVRFKSGDNDVSNADQSIPRSEWSCAFADEEINVILNDWGGNVDYAAIQVLRYIAAHPEFQVRNLHVLNMDADLGDVSATLNTLADEIFRSRTEFPQESIAEVGVDDFARRRILYNRIMRQGGTSP